MRQRNIVQDPEKNRNNVLPQDAAPETHMPDGAPPGKNLPPAALRALQEAGERRRRETAGNEPPQEVGGRGGKDPARFGDWEVNGRAVDF